MAAGRGRDDGAIASLSRGDPKTLGLSTELLELILVMAPEGAQFQTRAPGQQIVTA